jgi:flagellar biogenesis protein FliO
MVHLKMKFVFAVLLITGIICLALSAPDSSRNRIGGFDIGKVRELSADPNAVMANNNGGVAAKPEPRETNYTLVILRIIGSLVLIIILIFGVSWVARKIGLIGTSKIGGGGSMDIVEVLPLGQNRNVVMFRVMDVIYLCGQTPGSMVLLDKYEGEKVIEIMKTVKGAPAIFQFKDAFNHFIGKMKK